MISREDLIDIMKSFIGSILVVLLISLGIWNYLYTSFINPNNVIILHLNIYALILIAIILFLILIYFVFSYSHMYVYNGREDAMKANSKLLKIKKPRDRSNRYILSTRISFWPLSESSPARAEFRNLLTKIIEDKIEVKRIWQIWCKDDVERLEFYLDKYKNHDNLSIKYLAGNFFMPEILSVYGKVVSVSIPQPSDPLKLVTAFHFYGKKEIRRWEGYFNLLWENAIPIKTAGNIDYQELEKLKDKMGG